MAFEPGGYADKLGNRYEGRWVVKQLLRLLNEEIHSVQVEPIGDDQRGVDIIVERNDQTKQFQQCKARNASQENWSLANLNDRGVLKSMQFQLTRNPDYEFALVSSVPATFFGDICESARNSNGNPEDFYKYQIQGDKRCIAFEKFCECLNLNHEEQTERATAFNYMNRIHVILWSDDQNSYNDLLGWASLLIKGNSKKVIACLADFAQNNLRKTLLADAVRKHLAGLGFHLRKLAYDSRVAPAVEDLQRRFEKSIAPLLVAGKLIPREETQELFKALNETNLIVIHGTRGYGKSGVLYELTHILQERGIPYLPIRLDRQVPRHTTKEFGVDIGLQESPVICLKSLLDGKSGVLIIDQLDALRWTSSHTASSLDVCKDMVREIINFNRMGKPIKVVLSCRTFDMENDPEIKSWLEKEAVIEQRFRKIEVKSLSEKSVEEIVKNVGGNYESLTNRQKQILSSPQHIAMWVIILQEEDTPDFQSGTQLMREFWKNRYQELEKAGVVASDANYVLDTLVNYMEQNGKISAPASLIENNQRVYTELQSLGIIRTDDDRVTFCHQTYLDFRIADRLLREIHQRKRNIKDWLGSKKEQSLFRREQLRQVLLLLCDESPNEFFNNIKELLESKDIRFHLKHLVLEVISQIEEPSQKICEYLLELFDDDYWNPHIKETIFFGKVQYIKFLIDKDKVTDTIDSDNEEKRNSMLWLLRSVNSKIPDIITEIISPYISKGGDWPQMVLNTMCWNCTDDSDAMFELRLRLARDGIVKDYINWTELAKKHQKRILRLIEAVISTWDTPRLKDNSLSKRGKQSRLEYWGVEIQNLKEIAINNPVYTWELLMPHVERLTAIKVDRYDGALNDWLYGDRLGHDNAKASISRGIVELLCESGKKMASDNTDVFLQKTSELNKSISPVTQQILITSYSALPIKFADEAINYLLADTSRFHLGAGYSEPEWIPAVRLIERYSQHCSQRIFKELENRIIHYHSSDEKEMAKYYVDSWKENHFWDYWGRDQYFLVPALCQKRCSKNTKDLIRVLKRKFDGYSKESFLRGGRIGGCGGVSSPLPKNKLHKISDKAWLEIFKNKKIPETSHSFKKHGPNGFVESSIEHFAYDLRIISNRYPERFAKLALQFPEDVHPRYIAAILDGVKLTEPKDVPDEEKALWEPATIGTIEAVLEKYSLGDNRSIADNFCRLIRERPEEKWSDNAINQLLDYAINHPDPEIGKLNVRCDRTSDEANIDDLFQNSFNCVRGAAALAIGSLLWEHSDWLKRLKPALGNLVNDPHPAVRVAAIEACLPLLNLDKDLAVNLFIQACEEDIRVAACGYAVRYFNCCMQSHTNKLSHIIVQMFNSDKDEVAEKGAEEVCARWLFWGLFENELNQGKSGSVVHRKGIATVASHFVTKEVYTEKCRDLLLPLFGDDNADVRKKARHAFYNKVESLELQGIKPFINRFIQSQAFRDDPTGILFTFEKYTGSIVPFADSIFTICEEFAGPLAELSRDISQGLALDASKITSLLLRLYEQSKENNPDISEKCLDAWDILFENRIGRTREMIKEIEL